MNLTTHPLAEAFPRMLEEEFEALKVDIQRNGLQSPIVLMKQDGGDQILDGRHRYRACQELGVEFSFVYFEGENPVDFVLSVNLHRRHLTTSQKAAVAAELLDRLGLRTDAAERRSSALKQNELPSASIESNGKASEKAAKLMGVSRASVERADKVRREGTPQDWAEIKSGRSSVHRKLKEIDGRKPRQRRKSVKPLEIKVEPLKIVKPARKKWDESLEREFWEAVSALSRIHGRLTHRGIRYEIFPKGELTDLFSILKCLNPHLLQIAEESRDFYLEKEKARKIARVKAQKADG